MYVGFDLDKTVLAAIRVGCKANFLRPEIKTKTLYYKNTLF